MRIKMTSNKNIPNCMEILKKNIYNNAWSINEDESTKLGIIKKQNLRKTAEIAEVEQLNPFIVPILKKSKIIESLQLKRKLRHETLLRKLADELNVLNMKIEENIKISSEEVKCHMDKNQNYLKQILMDLNKPEVASYHVSVFFDLRKMADDMRTNQIRMVAELYNELSEFENRRAMENERIFHQSFQKIEKNAHILPYEVQTFIETETLKMNQLTLNNRRCYEDLKLKLTLITEYTYKSFTDEIFCLKEKWARYNMYETFGETDIRTEEISEIKCLAPELKNRFELQGEELVLHPTLDGCYNIVESQEWYANIRNIFEKIGNHNHILNNILIKIIQSVNEYNLNRLEEIKKFVTSLDRLNFYERSIQPILFDILYLDTAGESGLTLNDLEAKWQETMKYAKGVIDEVYEMVISLEHLWTRHRERLRESKCLVLKAVQKVEEDNRLALQELEVNLNLNIDALRQEFDETKLETLYKTVSTSLDTIKDKYEKNYIREVTVIEDYYKMVDTEADVLSSDINEFIYSKYDFSSNKANENLNNIEDFLDCQDSAFQKEIQNFLVAVNCLNISKSEVLKELEYFSNMARERMKNHTEEWVNIKIHEFSTKCQTQLELHSKRYDRIRNQVYEVRANEIHLHKRVFDEHKAGVLAIYKKLNKSMEDLYSKTLANLEEYRAKLVSLMESAVNEESIPTLKSIQAQVMREKSDFLKDFAVRTEQIRGEIEFKASEVQQSTLKFMKSIRLFHENGNYHVDEANIYITELENIEKESSNETKNLLKEKSKKDTEVKQCCSEIFDKNLKVLSQLYEERKFDSCVKKVLRLYKTDLKDLIGGLREDLCTFVNQCNIMILCIDDETKLLSQEEDDSWVVLLDILYKNVSNLFFLLNSSQWQEYAGEETSVESNTKKKDIQYSDMKLSAGDAKDIREEFFDSEFFNQNNSIFLNSICKVCIHYMEYLLKIASIFYKNFGSKTQISGALIKPQYEEFEMEILRIFHSSVLYCEQVWMQTVLSFLPLLGKVKTFFNRYFDRRTGEYVKKVLGALDGLEVQFTKCFNQNQCDMLNELKGLDNKLLPLHGYPRNNHLLILLEEDVVHKTAELELGWELFIRKYKKQLKFYHTDRIEQDFEWQMIRRNYFKYAKALFKNELEEGLISQLNRLLEKEGFVNKTIFNGSVTYEDIPEKYCLDLDSLIGVLEDSCAYLKEIKQILYVETTDITQQNGRALGSDKDESLDFGLYGQIFGLLQKPDDLEDLFARKMRKKDRVYMEIKNLIYSKENVHKEIIFGWLDKWKVNVAKIIELYSVKYPESDGRSQEPYDDCKGAQSLKDVSLQWYYY